MWFLTEVIRPSRETALVGRRGSACITSGRVVEPRLESTPSLPDPFLSPLFLPTSDPLLLPSLPYRLPSPPMLPCLLPDPRGPSLTPGVPSPPSLGSKSAETFR